MTSSEENNRNEMHSRQQQDLWVVPLPCHTQFNIFTFFLGQNSCGTKYFGTMVPQVWVCVSREPTPYQEK